MGVYSAAERPFQDVRHVGIAITALRERVGQQHVAILYTHEDRQEVRLLHLVWPDRVSSSRPKNTYLWIDLDLPAKRARSIAAFCRSVLDGNPNGIRYAFSGPMGAFDSETGRFLEGPNRLGLTCATFVLGVLDVAGLQLVRYETWPKSRSGDIEWKRHIIEEMRVDGRFDEAHVSQAEADIHATRYRPEDVAGAAEVRGWPVPFAFVESAGDAIVRRLYNEGLLTGR